MREVKNSRQRTAVLECLKSRTDHPTADSVFQSIRKDNPKISLGTVYRNLGLLADLGEIQKISCGDGIERYDYDTSTHYHFACRGCGMVIDLDMSPLDNIEAQVYDEKIGRIDSHSLIFYGFCKECLKNKN